MSYNAADPSAHLDTPSRLQALLCTPLDTHGSASVSLDIDSCYDQLLNANGDGMSISGSLTPAYHSNDAQESPLRQLNQPDWPCPATAGTGRSTGAELASGACIPCAAQSNPILQLCMQHVR